MIKRKPPVPISGVVYGEIIYWCTCLSALLVVGGTITSFLETDSLMPAGYLIDSVFEGRSVDEIWAASPLKRPPDALTYLSLLRYGEALTLAGIAFGVLSVAPAVFLVCNAINLGSSPIRQSGRCGPSQGFFIPLSKISFNPVSLKLPIEKSI